MNPQVARHCFQKMTALLSQQTDEIEGINAYLGDIKNAIAANEIETLNTLLTQQQLPMEDIINLENQRHQLLAAYGYELTLQGLEKCIGECDTNGRLEEQYQSFQQALLQLQRSIQVNSLLIDKNKNRIHKSLKLLTGQQNSDNSKTYASNGRTSGYSNKRSIAQA
jgi:flagellar biosynthesis/type III secretory pathway chaperone